MSHFYGYLQGARGEATRCGHKSSGLTVKAASWNGSIRVTLSHEQDVDTFDVTMFRHGHSHGWEGTIAHGVLGKQPELITLLPTPTIESFTDTELIDEVKSRFGITILPRLAFPSGVTA